MALKMSKSNENDGCATSCGYCERKFSQYKALYAHMRNFHKDKPITYKKKRKIICAVCEEEQQTMKLYWDHIYWKHPEVNLSFEKKFFYSEEDFDKWRKETEDRTHTHFTTARSMHVLGDERVVHQLQCDRSGFYKPAATPTRKCTSKKIGKFCPAYIYRTKTVEGHLMEIEVDFQSTHAGHKFDVHSLRIRSEQRERRLRSQGKSRWPNKVAPSPPSKNAIKGHNNDELDKKAETGHSFDDDLGENVKKEQNNNDLNENARKEYNNNDWDKNAKTGHSDDDDDLGENVKNEHNNDDLGENTKQEQNCDLGGKPKPFIMEISNLLQNDPNLEIQHVTCTCDQYATARLCEHVHSLLKSLNSVRPVQEKSVEEAVGSSFVGADLTPVVKEAFVNPVANSGVKSFEDEKALILKEFQQVVNMCQNGKHLEILKEFVTESKKHLISTLTHEQKTLRSSKNINEPHRMTSQSSTTPLLNAIPTSSQNTSISYVPYHRNLMFLRKT